MINNKKIKLGMFLLIGILLIVSISAYSVSTPQYIPPTSSSNYLNKQGVSLTQSFDKDSCKAGQDFVVQISLFGCTPTVVRSDLLEEQNVPVFCQLSATKINPLIDVEAIESISFKGNYPNEVSGVGFHPANAGIKTSQSTLLNSPILNNIGYVVVVLKKQPNESAMPDFVEGNMIANIKYDVKNAFGIGTAQYYLPQISDEDWNSKYKQYGFWKGKGFLKAENIEKDGATISIYSGEDTSTSASNKITSVSLTKGKTSGKINVPGFYCLASLQLRLDDLVVPDTRAKFEISGETVEVIKGEKFLDNKCYVSSLDKKGLYQNVKVYCSTDSGGKDFTFKISPKVSLKVNDEEKNYELGQTIGDNIYVGYIGAKKLSLNKVIDTTEKENLVVYFYKSGTDLGRKLSDSKLLSIARSVESKLSKDVNLNIGKDIIGVKGEGDVFTKKINVIGFAGAQNVLGTGLEKLEKELAELKERLRNPADDEEEMALPQIIKEKQDEVNNFKIWEDSLTNYKEAIKTYDEIINSYSGLKFDEDKNLKDVSYGEQALYDKIELADKVGQKASAVEFCKTFKDRWPESSLLNSLEDECNSEYMIANSESATLEVLINGVVNSIKFKGVYEPSEEEYSAEISVGGEDYILTKNDVVESKNGTVQLISLDDDYANVKVSYPNKERNSISKTINLKENIVETFGDVGNTNTIVLTEINLKKQAKVSVLPSIDNVGTEANFMFRVGIEKRAIKLSPEKTLEKIKDLNETIEKWQDISDDLGKVVKGMKAACLGTSAFLTVKNLFSGFSGKAAARHDVTEMYRDKCKKDGAVGTKAMQACLLKYNDVINTDIASLAEMNTERDKNGDELSNSYDEKGKLKSNKLIDEVKASNLSKKLLEEDNYRSELRDILYYQDMQRKGGIFKEEADKKLGEIWKGLDDDYDKSNLGISAIEDWKKSGLEGMTVQSSVFKDQRPISYTGATSSGKLVGIGTPEKPVPVQGVLYKDSKVYILELSSAGGGTYGIKNVYNQDGRVIEDSKLVSEIKGAYSVKKFDEKSYSNKYNTPEVIYYEIGTDKGRPSIVPVDVDKGFYAATTPGTGTMSSYDASGMPSYFYLCNVMGNGKQEFNQGKDDECVGVRVGSNKADGALAGLTLAETNNWARKAISAMRDASRQYKAGVTQITINGKKISVGNPAANFPGTQCEDFMSPEDCVLLFNVCDPVICPESRCDFGGKYRVSNVIQSGIIGSALLCLPNFGSPAEGGVVIPVCLSGIHAGIDSLLSVYKNYGDCLQHSLDTGETVAICDEIHSIYLCEFFWKQALPLSKIVFTNVLEFILTGGRGGGEYLQVGAAWANAGKSVDYMTNYYGANAFLAFKARATDEVKTEVCRNFISAQYPASGDFFDALLEPDSPSQFHGWFHETTFTTATVPPTSQYKVFYHIYSGKDSGVYYSVYLKSPVGSSFYADAPRVDVASGYIQKGGYASETRDMLAVSGYKEMCINVQGQEECGFKEVSTSFAVDYLNDQYVKDQAERTDIKSEAECISGSASLYSMATPNVQAGVESVIDPQIYDQGIVRVCSTSNPGEATDQTRWVNVGTCGGTIKCWLDKDSVGDAVNFDASLGGLEKVTEDALEKLKREGKYLSAADFENLIKEINEEKNNDNKIVIIDSVLKETGTRKVLLNKEKAQLLYLKAKAYVGLVLDKIKEKGVVSEPVVGEEETITAVEPTPAKSVDTTKTPTDFEVLKKVFENDACKDYVNMLYDSSGNYLYEEVDFLLLIAVMQQESGCGAEKDDGESFGLMGITESTFEEVCEDEDRLTSFEDIKGIDNARNNINCGVMILRNKYNLYGVENKNENYKRLVKEYCKDETYQKKYLEYTEWLAALRGYNGLGCVTGEPDYVEEVSEKMSVIQGKFSEVVASNVVVDVEVGTCNQCDNWFGACDEVCVEDAGLSCESIKKTFWFDDCKADETKDCLVKNNWEKTTKETSGFAVDNLKIIRTYDYEGMCDGAKAFAGEIKETGYSLVDNGDGTYRIKDKGNKEVGNVLGIGYIRDKSEGSDELMKELISYTFDGKVFELIVVPTGIASPSRM